MTATPSNRSQDPTETVTSRDQFAEIRAARITTGILAVSAVAGVVVHALRFPAVAVALALFLYGVGCLVATLVIGAGRSRTENVDLFGLFFTEAPMQLRLLFLAQVVVAFVTAALKATASFGVLATLAGLGLCGLYGARHGTFPPRPGPSATEA